MLHIILSCFYPHKKCMSPAGIFHKDSERSTWKNSSEDTESIKNKEKKDKTLAL